jgi:hypothetical protein
MGRVVFGGLLAGLIINIGEFVLNELVLGAQWAAAVQALGRPPIGGSAIAIFVVGGFILGIAMIWTYAAIRPRQGAGPKTAVCAGLLVWFFAYLYPSSTVLVMGLLPANLIVTSVMWGFFELPIAAVIGAWLYKEE